MEITTVYQKERQHFGKSTHHFVASDVILLEEFEQDKELTQQHIERNPTILDIQAKPEMSENYVRDCRALCLP